MNKFPGIWYVQIFIQSCSASCFKRSYTLSKKKEVTPISNIYTHTHTHKYVDVTIITVSTVKHIYTHTHKHI